MRTLACLVTLALVTNCTSSTPTPSPSTESTSAALGETVAGLPNAQERMLQVLINRARHEANHDDCGNFTAEVGANPRKQPLVYSREANAGARFTARMMSEVGCYQNDNCCVLALDAGAGVGIGCVAPAACTGAQCATTCDAGVGQNAEQRYGLFGYTTLAATSISRGDARASDTWCNLMKSPGIREFIYSDAGTEFASGTFSNAEQTCSTAYWAFAFGRGAVSSIPKIPSASAMYPPPNPRTTADLSFAANYFDATGKAPKLGTVVVDGHCFDLERRYGADDNGTYVASFPDPDVLPEGCHSYYFLFFDGDGNRTVYPTTGSLTVPLGADVTCPIAYDPSAQAKADCETDMPACPTGAVKNCFTADPNLLKAGECRQGTQRCRNGFWGACRDMVGPFPEACDGLDNDCDGQVDEGDPGSGASCSIFGELGACQAGTRHCVSGRLTCVSNAQPSTEVCDGKDNDCDGVVDDGLGQVTCGTGNCYRLVDACVQGVPQQCTPGPSTAEADDGKDNDCDGVIDNGFDCRRPDGGFGFTRQVYPIAGNPSQLPCIEGVQVCQADGGWSPVINAVIPTPEVCDGNDNDCDGTDDTQQKTLTLIGYERCGVGACTVKTVATCISGNAKTCKPLTAGTAELCDGVDNTCDGTVDELCQCRADEDRVCYTGPAETRDIGVCKSGTRSCVNGKYTKCTDEVKPSQEYCNGLDDDCDGTIDNACLNDAGILQPAGDAGAEQTDGGMEPSPMKPCSCTTPASGSVLMLALMGLRARRTRREVP